MTGIKQPHHFHTIAADETGDVKPWRLPFWTEKPAWLIEKEAKEEAEAKAEDDAVEEASEDIALPTAEELENIRREAYNDGLEQGLIEGRQQGRKEGHEEGHEEGYKAAFDQGQQEGRKEGFKTGEEEGRRKAQADIDAVVRRLNRIEDQLLAAVAERDQQLPDVLTQMVVSVCQHVLAAELSQGAVSIHQFVRRSLDELPSGEKNIRVVVSPDDARHLQTSLEVCGDELHYSVDDKLAAGQCRVESEHSLIEYSTADHMQQLLERVQQQLLHQAHGFPDDGEKLSTDSLDSDVLITEHSVTEGDIAEAVNSAADENPLSESGLHNEVKTNHSSPEDSQSHEPE